MYTMKSMDCNAITGSSGLHGVTSLPMCGLLAMAALL